MADVRRRTASSFAYEWKRFDRPPEEMEENFAGYFQQFEPEYFGSRRVLEIGPGMGRHTFHLARLAREVVAVDLGEAIFVARKNTAAMANAHFVRGDVHSLPFAAQPFDFACAIGVLHHAPDPAIALAALVDNLKPGGDVLIYVYWDLEDAPAWQRGLLRIVTTLRRVTIRMPYPVLNMFAWLAAVVGYGLFSMPYKYLSRWRRTKRLAASLPLKRYAVDGFRVCHNDQFDRFSAPIERRHSRSEVLGWFEALGLTGVDVRAHHGWLARATRPL